MINIKKYNIFFVKTILLLSLTPCFGQKTNEATIGLATGLPVPRFISLRSKKTNMRSGPSRSHAIKWQYHRHGLPVEVIGEFGYWRKIRDMDGSEGWMHQIVLSGRRTIVTLEGKNMIRKKPKFGADLVAKIEGGIVLSPQKCTLDWCYVTHKIAEGWIEKNNIYGVYPDETF